jgi:hypothetical protein
MNDRAARKRRYVRLLLEGFTATKASEMVKPKKRSFRLRKPLPLEPDLSSAVVRPARGANTTNRKIVGIWE